MERKTSYTMQDISKANESTVENQVSSRKKTKCLWTLTITCVLLILALIAVIVLAVFVAKCSHEGDSDEHVQLNSGTPDAVMCLTPSCISAASRISQGLDLSVNPCNNFYQFSCGGWMKKNDIPEKLGKISAISVLQEQLFLLLKKLLEEDVKPADFSFVVKAKNFYTSCINQDQDIRGYGPLQDMIESEFGVWPLTPSNWNESTFDLIDLIIKSNRHGVNAILQFYVDINIYNVSSNVMKFLQPDNFGLGDRLEYLVDRNSSRLMAYEERIFQIARIFGVDNETMAREESAAIVDLEIKVANATAQKPYQWNIKNDIKTWHARFSNQIFDLLKFFTTVVSAPDVGIYDVTENETILTTPGLYLQNLLPQLLITPKRTIVNYIIWRVIESYLDTVEHKQTVSEKEPWSSRSSRESECVEAMAYKNDLKYAASQMFLQEQDIDKDKSEVMEMISWIKEAVMDMMSDLKWIDQATLQMSKAKVVAMRTDRVGYSKRVFNISYLENYYSNVTFTSDNYFENTLKMRKDSWLKMARSLRIPNDIYDLWQFLPIIVNAFYDPDTNSVEFPASIFQPPYFSSNNQKSLQFGGLGVVIGHEIVHSFDTTGIGLWNSSAVASFKKQAQCFIDQYNRYFDEETNTSLNGMSTLNENIADNGGLRNGFRAYRKWVASQKEEEPALPGLNYTHNQLYFIAYAQACCELSRKEERKADMTMSLWSINRYRVIGPVQNSEDFAKAFSCPLNSYMNPRDKCVLW